MGNLQRMLDAQDNLQVFLTGKSPKNSMGEERKDFVRTMGYALEDEIHEATQEVSWKPWAKADFLNRGAYIGELVDAWHFFMNLMLVADITEDEFEDAYYAKRKVNMERKVSGYTGIDKCSNCHRDLLETPVAAHTRHSQWPDARFCTPTCANKYTG